MGIAQRRQPAEAMDLRIDTLAISDSGPHRRQPAHHPRRADSDSSACFHNNQDTSPSSSTMNDYNEDDQEEDETDSLASPSNRGSYYTPSSERHVRWSAELAEIIDSSPSSSSSSSSIKSPTKGLQKLLHRRSSHQQAVLVSPQRSWSSTFSESSERKQGRSGRIMTPKGSYLKAKRRVSS